MPYSTVSYTGDGSTAAFTVPFSRVENSNVHVTVDNVTKTFTWTDTNEITLSPAPSNGAVVTIERSTDIDEPATVFQDGSAFVAGDLNTNFYQFLYIIQELQDTSSLLRDHVDEVVIASGALPSPGASGSFLISNGSTWVVNNLAATKTVLGIASLGSSVPTASATLKVLTSNSNAYALQDASTFRTSIGLGSAYGLNVPGGGPYTTLGTAAFKDTGTSAGNVPLVSNLGTAAFRGTTDGTGVLPTRLVAVVDNGSAGNGLPAMDGSLLTGIKKMGDYYKVDEKQSTATHGGHYDGGWQTRDLNYEVVDEIGVAAPSSGTITLPAGKYVFRATSKCVGMGMAGIQVVTAAGTSLGRSLFLRTNPLDDPGDSAADAPAETLLEFSGTFALGGSTGIKLQIRGTTSDDLSETDYALGLAHETSGLGLNTYSTLELWKIR